MKGGSRGFHRGGNQSLGAPCEGGGLQELPGVHLGQGSSGKLRSLELGAADHPLESPLIGTQDDHSRAPGGCGGALQGLPQMPLAIQAERSGSCLAAQAGSGTKVAKQGVEGGEHLSQETLGRWKKTPYLGLHELATNAARP
jgi:hypothetical protein